ncbi:MAG: GTP cyclohydrolase II [Spirochaetaceae bacterium]|nr:GTP cyclohydrolase II [Spirochaetaceae bacterium]
MFKFNTIEEAISSLRNGKIIIVSDDENRENEGDLICAAEFATTENVNFMATHGKGLICLPISKNIANKLKIPQMVIDNNDNHHTAFTISVDAINTTTGISAEERGITARKFATLDLDQKDFRYPGHLFPLVANKNGVLARNGHTEATVDLMKLANLKECGLCCEIIAKDGTMLKKEGLIKMAEKWNLKYITIQNLQKYLKINSNLIKRVASPIIQTEYGIFQAFGYENIINHEEHIALVKGDIGDGKNILCRIHSECLTGDVFHSAQCDCGKQLELAMKSIQLEKKGIVVYMRQEGRGIGLLNKLKAYELQSEGYDTVEANTKLGFKPDLREYYISVQILKDLGVKSLNLMTNNPDKISQCEEFGIEVVHRVPTIVESSIYDKKYQKTKQIKMGHYLNIQ